MASVAVVAAPVADVSAVVVVAAPSNELVEYFATPMTVAARGGPLYLVNTDGVPHSVVSYAKRPDGTASWCTSFDPGQCPLFWSAEVVHGATEVLGLAGTASGVEYAFYCGVHPTMHGTLLIA